MPLTREYCPGTLQKALRPCSPPVGLHGSCPENCIAWQAMAKAHPDPQTALLIIDMLNTLEFNEGPKLLRAALPAAHAILKLKRRVKKRGVPVIYVNDNFGQWRANWKAVHELCVHPKSLGKSLAELLKPEEDDYFVLKPKHSGFYSTTLEVLLSNLKATRLIVTGIAGNICVLFTVNDAYMRDFELVVPADCMACNSPQDKAYTIRQLSRTYQIPTPLGKYVRVSAANSNSK